MAAKGVAFRPRRLAFVDGTMRTGGADREAGQPGLPPPSSEHRTAATLGA